MKRAAYLRAAPALLVLLALPGCIGIGSANKAPASLLALTAIETPKAGTTASGKASDMVLVMEPETDRRLATVRIPVQVDDTQVAYLKDVQWVERPGPMFAHLVAETLRARSGRLVLEEGQNAGTPGIRLSGKLVDMGYDARTGSVVVRFDALRTSTNGEVISRRFEAVVPHVAPRHDAVGPALNGAANDVAGQVADWMGS